MNPSPRSVAQWLAWQEQLNPRLIDLGLERLRPVAARMGLADLGAPLITVGGTNGKGSTIAYLEALASAHGLRSACYASPWLISYNESVRVCGEPVRDAVLVDAFERVEQAREDVPLTAFECRTLAAAHVIRASDVDLALLEVGMGGRLDAVNLFDPHAAVITSIGLDHCEWLGHTLEAIAGEKAGIFRRNRPAVCADAVAVPLLEPLARGAGAVPWLAGRELNFGGSHPTWWLRVGAHRVQGLPHPALAGAHQHANATGAVAAFTLSGVAGPGMDEARVASALRAVRLRGRLERVPGAGERRVDVAHNPQAAQVLGRWIAREHPHALVRAVCAMYADKDHANTLRALLPWVKEWYLAGLPGPRGAPAARLADALASLAPGACVHRFDSVEEAWAAAGEAPVPDLLLAFGSFETARRVLRLESATATPET